MKRRHATWIYPRSATFVFRFSSENWRFLFKASYAVLRTSADVATRPWRTPRFACRRSQTITHLGVWKRSMSCGFPQDGEIILHPPFRRQIAKLKIKARRNEITVRTKSRRICRGEAVASESRPYQDGATDLHPALSSPSATPLRSRGYASRLSEPMEHRRAQKLRIKTRLMEGEARDEGASAELSDMQRRGSSDAR